MNQELLRNIWLEISFKRIAILVVVLLLVFVIATQALDPLSWLSFCGSLIFTLSGCVGTWKASESVSSEVRDNTWDFQRMSSVGAWELTLGKLFGATVFCSIGAAVGLAVFVASELALGQLSLMELINVTSIRMAGLVFLYSVGIVMSLGWTASMRGLRRTRGSSVIILFTMFMFAFTGLFRRGMPGSSQKLNETEIMLPVMWWGNAIERREFFLCSILLFMAWGLLGAYRLMRAELQYKLTPFAWTLFLLFCWFYLAGFWHGDVYFGLVGMCVAGAWTYYGLLNDNQDIIIFRKLVNALKVGAYLKAWINTPRWLASLLICVIATAIFVVTSPHASLSLLGIAGLLFLIRDCCVIISLHVRAPNHRRNQMTALVYFLLVYLLLPLFFGALGGKNMTALFYPPLDPEVSSFVSIAAFSLEALLAAAFLVRSWREQQRGVSAL